MNRFDLQLLASERIADAQGLLATGNWSGAYYIAGYSVECALKACIAKSIRAEDFPDKKLANDAYTHNLETLVTLANLTAIRESLRKLNTHFASNWSVVKNWTEKSRYQLWTESDAREIVDAISHPQDGVLPWIRIHW